MFTKILWATDGSQASDVALPLVRDLAAQHQAQVVVFHGDEHLVGPRTYGLAVYADEDDMKEKIRKQAQSLADDGFDASVTIEKAHSPSGVAHDIAEAADRDGADLIVVGTRGHTALGGLLLGSVTQRLLHIAHCPVMVVPVPSARAGAESATDAAATTT